MLNWKKENSDSREFRRNSEPQVRIELTTSDVLITEPLKTLWRAWSEFYLQLHQSYKTIARFGDLLEIGRPPAYKTKTVQYNLEEGEF